MMTGSAHKLSSAFDGDNSTLNGKLVKLCGSVNWRSVLPLSLLEQPGEVDEPQLPSFTNIKLLLEGKNWSKCLFGLINHRKVRFYG